MLMCEREALPALGRLCFAFRDLDARCVVLFAVVSLSCFLLVFAVLSSVHCCL